MIEVKATLEHLFRRQAGSMVAYLTRYFGTDHLDLAESVVQEALLKALQSWPTQGIPENPEAWIMRAAKNSAIDAIRKKRDLPHDAQVLEKLIEADWKEGADIETLLSEEIKDDQLKLFFICCHPALSREARTALTLKTVCGFGVNEIARAFLAKEETIAQRIVRAKNKITELKLKFELPSTDELSDRITSVLEVLYLLFNEGYLATSGESLVRRDLCEEAIFRTTALVNHRVGNLPSTYALLALMHFQISRFDSRADPKGELLLLEEQDRSLWDTAHLKLGMQYLEQSASGEELSQYHLQAGIASCHSLASSFEKTDWAMILKYYDLLLLNHSSPIVALNRAVALAMVEGWEAGLAEIETLREIPELKSYYLLYATTAEFNRRMGRFEQALKSYEQALPLVGTEPERRLIQKRIVACRKFETDLRKS